MKTSKSLSDLMSLPYSTRLILENLIKQEATRIYLYLTQADNPTLLEAAFYEFANPKRFLMDLNILLAEQSYVFDFEYRVEVLHSLTTELIDDYSVFKSAALESEKITCTQTKSEYQRLKSIMPNEYLLSTVPDFLSKQRMMDGGYGEITATATCKKVNFGIRGNIGNSFVTTTKIINSSNIWVGGDANLVIEANNMTADDLLYAKYPFLNPKSTQFNEKMVLMLEANRNLLDNDGKCDSYGKKFHSFATETECGKRLLDSAQSRGIPITENMLTRALAPASSPVVTEE